MVAKMREVELVEKQVGGLQLRVVTNGAILIQERTLASAV
jgi:hypothetical protein